MTDRSVPLSVGILSHNSVELIGKAIRSVSDAADVVVCDGRSTDGTRELVESLGSRLIDQDPSCLDAQGRLTDIAGIREQVLRAAEYDWILFLDSDELATPELLREIADNVIGSRSPGAYQVPRKYMLDGELIECAMSYPTFQTRLVNRNAVVRYDGLVHDVPVLAEGESTGTLSGEQLVPQPPFRELWRKWVAYMRLEEIKKCDLTRVEWAEQVLRPHLKSVRWMIRRYLQSRRDCCGRRMPIRYEAGRIAYQLGVVFYTGRRFLGVRRADLDGAWGRR